MMQTHPIDLVREQLALASFRFGQGVMGLASALALIGLMWVGSLRPADAAGPGINTDFTASAKAGGNLGVAALRPEGGVLAQTVVSAASTSVCRLELDLDSEVPLAADCAPAPVVTQ